MNTKALLGIFAILVTTVGALAFAGLTIISSAMAQGNGTFIGNLTMGAANITDTNMTNGTGNISGANDPFP